MKGILTLLLAGALLILLVASATIILVAVAGGIIGILLFLLRRVLRGGRIPAANPPGGSLPTVQEATPACPYCGSGLGEQFAGAQSDALRCGGCGKSFRGTDVVYVVHPR